MPDALIAEWLKLRRYRASWLMVWIFPIAVGLVIAGTFAYHAVAGPGAPSPDHGAKAWLADSTLLLRYPASAGARCLAAGFAALVFAGEGGWNTWKLVVPARARWQLIVAKWIVVIGLLVAALIAADAIGLLATGIETLQGRGPPAGVTPGAIAAAHARGFGFALVPIVTTVAFAALFAILTRSLLAAIILSIGMIIAEGLMPVLAILGYPHAPTLVTALVKALPFFHLLNIGAWARGAGLVLPLTPTVIIRMSCPTSLAVLGAWTVAAGAATIARFHRQDLN